MISVRVDASKLLVIKIKYNLLRPWTDLRPNLPIKKSNSLLAEYIFSCAIYLQTAGKDPSNSTQENLYAEKNILSLYSNEGPKAIRVLSKWNYTAVYVQFNS